MPCTLGRTRVTPTPIPSRSMTSCPSLPMFEVLWIESFIVFVLTSVHQVKGEVTQTTKVLNVALLPEYRNYIPHAMHTEEVEGGTNSQHQLPRGQRWAYTLAPMPCTRGWDQHILTYFDFFYHLIIGPKFKRNSFGQPGGGWPPLPPKAVSLTAFSQFFLPLPLLDINKINAKFLEKNVQPPDRILPPHI